MRFFADYVPYRDWLTVVNENRCRSIISNHHDIEGAGIEEWLTLYTRCRADGTGVRSKVARSRSRA